MKNLHQENLPENIAGNAGKCAAVIGVTKHKTFKTRRLGLNRLSCHVPCSRNDLKADGLDGFNIVQHHHVGIQSSIGNDENLRVDLGGFHTLLEEQASIYWVPGNGFLANDVAAYGNTGCEQREGHVFEVHLRLGLTHRRETCRRAAATLITCRRRSVGLVWCRA